MSITSKYDDETAYDVYKTVSYRIQTPYPGLSEV